MPSISGAQASSFRPQPGSSGNLTAPASPTETSDKVLGEMYQPVYGGTALKGMSSYNYDTYGKATGWMIKQNTEATTPGHIPDTPMPLSKRTFGSFFNME